MCENEDCHSIIIHTTHFYVCTVCVSFVLSHSYFLALLTQGNLQPGKNDELVNKMPSLMKLKNAIYSSEYRAFVERITGLPAGTLTEEVSVCVCMCGA